MRRIAPLAAVSALMLAATMVPCLPASAGPGDLDASFGTNGMVITDFGGDEVANGAAVQADGKIVVAGSSDDDMVVVRYTADGALDTSFGVGGRQTTDFGAVDVAAAVAIQGDGRIVVAGSTQPQSSPTDPNPWR